MPWLRRGTYSYKQRLIFSKSIDVRWKTLAQIQAEWWNIYNWRWSYTLDSNWLSVSTNNASLMLYYATPTLTTSNTIEMKYSWYCTSAENTSNYGWVCWLWLFGQLSSTYYNYWLYGTYNSWYNPNWWYTGMVYNWSQIWNQWWRNKGWNISYTMNINLWTWVVDYHITSPVSDFTTTYTLNSTQITDVLSKWYIWVVIEEFTNWYIMRVTNVEFTIS